MNLLLFDVDLTLINSGGSGRRSMTIAFEQLFGTKNGFHKVDFAGRTDVLIFKDALANLGRNWSADLEEKFRRTYLANLPVEIEKLSEDQHIEPGVTELLDILVTREDMTLGLLTGNWQAGAKIKLEHFGLFEKFTLGAFADDSGLRADLPAIAARRFEEKFETRILPSRVYVIGDTPRDVKCARPFGAKTVAVATGLFSREQLQAAGPDYLFEDLTDHAAFLNLFDGKS
jgi:phosphoglycolate phosphatase-like HAD superfamily hydrolase